MNLVGETLGRYRIVEPLGHGGMATIYKARQPALERFVAVKVLPAQLALMPGFSERFVREARAVAQLNHPNILPIHDFGQEGELSYIVMKLVSGGTLQDRLGQPMDLTETARLVEGIAAALDHAHGRDILHRDVKPSNVLLDEGDWVQLADFGLAKMMAGDERLTASGVSMGTPAYISPEQGQGLPVDRRTDVYSLGVILYEMVTGQVPFTAETPMGIVIKHISAPPPRPSQVYADTPPAVEAVILKALEKKPEDRFASAGGLADALWQAVRIGEAGAEIVTVPLDDFIPKEEPVQVRPSQYTPLPEISLPPEPPRLPEAADFVGREAELAYFAEKMATSHLAVITGMAGVGKTALAVTLARRFAEADQVFWHAFHEGEGVDALLWKLASFLAWRGQEDLWHMLQGARQTGGQPPPIEVLFDYLFQMLRGRGYLLCLDDWHFVDDDPLLELLVERMCRAVDRGELSLIVTSRRVPEFVTMAEFETLAGLGADDTDALLAQRGIPLSKDLVADLHTSTEGNAELLTLAVEALERAQDPERVISRLTETDDIERYLMTEVDAGLTEGEREVMSAVAVLLGYPGTRDAVETVLDGGSVRRTLADLSRRCLLTAGLGQWGKEYGLHAMVRTFYYDLLGRRERREMHRRAGEYYETEEPDALKAARHLERTGDVERAVELVAADVWGLINQGQARGLRLLLERFTAQQLTSVSWAEVNLARGQVYGLLGEGGAARDSYQAVLSGLSALGDLPRLRALKARACRGMGELLEHESPQEALEWLGRGLEELAGSDEQEEAALLVKISSAQIVLGDLETAQDTARRSLKLLPKSPNQMRARALMNLGIIHAFQGDIGQGSEYTTGALEINRQLGDDFRIAEVLNNLSNIKYMSGDWTGAIVDWREALKLAERLGSVKQQTKLGLNLGFAYTRQGNLTAARECLLNSLKLACDHDFREYQINIHCNLADLHLRQEDAGAAVASLSEAEVLTLEAEMEPFLPEIYRSWALAHLARDDTPAAQEAIEQSLHLARELGLPPEEGMSLRVQGQALLADGQPEQALGAFESSLKILAGQDPYEAARTKVQLARCLATEDAERRARLLEEARATFRELGAQRDLAAVDEILRT